MYDTDSIDRTSMAAREAVRGPVTAKERIGLLDVIRGMAILGILMVNMQSFAYPDIVHDNPAAVGDFTGLNVTIWHGMHLLFQMKFHTIFAALFGAGMVLMLERAEQAGREPLSLHFRRMLGLLLIGMLHAYLIWQGDILVNYALCGCFVVLLRNLQSSLMALLAFTMLAIPTVFCLAVYALVTLFPEHTTQPLMEEWWPSQAALAETVATYQGSWLTQLPDRALNSLMVQTIVFAAYTFWRVGGLMLLGILLYRTGIITGARSTRFYLVTLTLTLVPGLVLIEHGLQQIIAHEWDPRYAIPFGHQFNYWASLLVAMSWICGIALLIRSKVLTWLTTSLAAVGRIALTNYLMQSLICTFIFYGHGLGWYGETPRTTQLLLVLAIWALQLLISPLWLRYFRFGPVEYVWRWMTYGRMPAIRNASIQIERNSFAS